jgi:hypothetical protein
VARGGPEGAASVLAVPGLDGRRGGDRGHCRRSRGPIALLSFGLDSAIEGFASLVIVWRFTGWRLLSHAAEERAQKLVAVQNLLCAYLAVAVLVGLAGNALFGLWWLDPAAALVVAAVAVKEGRESWRGKGCCASCHVADVLETG